MLNIFVHYPSSSNRHSKTAAGQVRRADVRQYVVESGDDAPEAGAGRRISCPAGRQQVGQLRGERIGNFRATTSIYHFPPKVLLVEAIEGHLAGQHLPKEDAEAVYFHLLVVWLRQGNLTHSDKQELNLQFYNLQKEERYPNKNNNTK